MGRSGIPITGNGLRGETGILIKIPVESRSIPVESPKSPRSLSAESPEF